MAIELYGTESDETRLLALPSVGYSVPIPGHPLVVDANRVAMRDAPVEYTFWWGEVPLAPDPRQTANDLAVRIARARSGGATVREAHALAAPVRPRSSVAGSSLLYPTSDAAMQEEIWVALRPLPHAHQVLYRITRWDAARIDLFTWHHIRTALGGHHHWDPAAPRTVTSSLWPPSELGLPGVSLHLTERAWADARAKLASLVEPVPAMAHAAIATLLHEMANHDFAPSAEMPAMMLEAPSYQLSSYGAVGELIARGLADVRTAFDYRCWCVQTAWVLAQQ